ncbi:DUF192 domain-containing protein [Spongiimicrobium sp. 3-5]|uniref:DUF192 domain-containing protein n=1 Tax=Spongiimicrobium sp. 3-5 TaxID=3332596 RepID=UPI00397F43EB
MTKIKSGAYLLLAVLFILGACKEEPKKVISTAPITFTKEGELMVYRGQTDTVLTKLNIEIAETDYETQTGLMYRNAMAENQGMLFIFPDVEMHSFYMKNTEIALDLIFLDENLHIASFQENAKPLDETGLSSKVPVQYVLEINAGLAEKWSLEVGDRVEFTRN